MVNNFLAGFRRNSIQMPWEIFKKKKCGWKILYGVASKRFIEDKSFAPSSPTNFQCKRKWLENRSGFKASFWERKLKIFSNFGAFFTQTSQKLHEKCIFSLKCFLRLKRKFSPFPLWIYHCWGKTIMYKYSDLISEFNIPLF